MTRKSTLPTRVRPDGRRRGRRTAFAVVAPAAAVAVLALAGCGSNGSSSSSAGGGTSGSTGMTVAVSDTSSGDVLTTSGGRTLYISDQEKNKVLCASGACEAIWTPLTVPSGDKPSAPAKVASQLSTVKRPDGSQQVTLDGRPLYTFSFDHSSGDVNGDGQKDSFDGVDFSWHAATPTGKAATAPGSGSSPSPYGKGGDNDGDSSGNSSSSGYGY
jgi:predicted lipoprotein with Yx(FWY)xxD motif